MTNCTNIHLSRYAGLAAGREDEQKRYFREKRLYSLQIESIDACNQGCIYCYAGSMPKLKLGLTSEEIRSLLEDLVELGVRAVEWLGGDPLLRPDWYELLQYARSLGFINNVWTSGIPLGNKKVAEKVLETTEGGFVSVHVDSINPDIYQKLHPRGDVRNIEKIIAGVDNLLAGGKSPENMINCIAYTSLQGPEDAIDTMTWFFERKGLRTCLTMFNPAGKGAELGDLEPGRADIARVFAARDRINYGDDGLTISSMDTDKYYCGTMATVTFKGDVTPCSVIRKGVANIRDTSFKDIIAEHLGTLIHSDLHDTRNLPKPCDACKNNLHCWGCRASAYHYSGDANGIDPKCWFIDEATIQNATKVSPK